MPGQKIITGNLDVVDENNNVIGQEDYEVIHNTGLLHRSIQMLMFRDDILCDMLLCQRSAKQKVGAFKYHPSVGGHVREGQNYWHGMVYQLGHELFKGQEIPVGVRLQEIARYRNDSRDTNREISSLFVGVYPGPFSVDSDEISKNYDWEPVRNIWGDMLLNHLDTGKYSSLLKDEDIWFKAIRNPKSDKYTFTFYNAMARFMGFFRE